MATGKKTQIDGGTELRQRAGRPRLREARVRRRRIHRRRQVGAALRPLRRLGAAARGRHAGEPHEGRGREAGSALPRRRSWRPGVAAAAAAVAAAEAAAAAARASRSISRSPCTLSAYGEWTKKSGYFELAPGGTPAPLIWTDKSIGAPIVAKNADRMIFTRADVQRVSELLAVGQALRDAEAGDRRGSDALQGVRVGHEEADRLQEPQGPASAGDADAAGRLRAGQEVSDARVLLRAHVEHASQLPAAAVRRPAAHGDVREQRLSRAAAGRRLRDRQAGHVGARLRRRAR